MSLCNQISSYHVPFLSTSLLRNYPGVNYDIIYIRHLCWGAVETQRLINHSTVQQKILLESKYHSAKSQVLVIAFVL